MYGVLLATLKRKIPFNIVRVSLAMMEDSTLAKLHTLIHRLEKVENETKEIRQELYTLSIGIKAKRSASTGSEVDFCFEESFKPKRPKTTTSNNVFQFEDDYVVVYTDGACDNNGKSNAKAGLGVWFGENNPLNISKPLEGKASNNRAEIYACIEALSLLKQHGIPKVKLYTDSQFTINCITQWVRKWKKNDWKTAQGDPVINREELGVLDELVRTFADIKWVHVRGHRGIKGNVGADQLARNGVLQHKRH